MRIQRDLLPALHERLPRHGCGVGKVAGRDGSVDWRPRGDGDRVLDLSLGL